MAQHTEGNAKTASLDLETSRQYIQDNINEIEGTAEQIIQENGYDYSAKAELSVRWIPQKSYGDIIFPSGNYEALNITIGEGRGHNWWCVLFPPLCLIGAEDPDNEQLTAETEEIYKEVLMDKKYQQLLEKQEKPTVLKLKFKTLEWLEEKERKDS